jgi:3-deoxy-D-manno-octulosonic acid (KDO) 8-phosphate synthase
MWIVAVQELARAGAGGVSASLKSNSIGAPPIARADGPIRSRMTQLGHQLPKLGELDQAHCDLNVG